MLGPRLLGYGALLVGLLVLPRVFGQFNLSAGYIDVLSARMHAGLNAPYNVRYEVLASHDTVRLARAQQRFRAALSVGESRPQALAGLAHVYSDSGYFRQAIGAWQLALSAGYEPQMANLALANLHAQEDNRPLAVQHWQASVSPNVEAWIYLSWRIFAQGGNTNRDGRWRDATQVLEDALIRLSLSDSQRASVHLELSDMYASLSDTEAGLHHARQAVAYAPEDAAAHAWLARFLQSRVGDDAQAVLAAERALSLGPNWWAHLVLGDIRLAGCELDAAIQHYQAGRNLSSGGDWRHIYLLEGLSLAYWERGDSAAALAAMERFAAQQPNIQRGQERLAQARTGDLPRRCLEEVK